MLAKVLNLPPGDLATWASSILVAATLAVLVLGTFRQRGEWRRQSDLDRSSQARQIGGWLISGTNFVGVKKVVLHLTNASQLPVREVRGYLTTTTERVVFEGFPPIHVLSPGDATREIVSEKLPDVVHLILAFTDDAGDRWVKYGREPLTRLSPGKTDLKGFSVGSGDV